MIGLFDPWTGPAWRIDDIEHVSQPRADAKGQTTRTVKFRTDRPAYEMSSREAETMMMRPVQFFPAHPGVNVVRTYHGDDLPPEAYRSTLIAWALCLDGEIRPVTSAGVNDGLGDNNHLWAEYPDGHVEAIGEFTEPCRCESVDQLLADITQINARHAELAATHGSNPTSDTPNAG